MQKKTKNTSVQNVVFWFLCADLLPAVWLVEDQDIGRHFLCVRRGVRVHSSIGRKEEEPNCYRRRETDTGHQAPSGLPGTFVLVLPVRSAKGEPPIGSEHRHADGGTNRRREEGSEGEAPPSSKSVFELVNVPCHKVSSLAPSGGQK